jgi:hypothetical protein
LLFFCSVLSSEIQVRSGTLDYQGNTEGLGCDSKPASDGGRLFILQEAELASLTLRKLLDIISVFVHEFSLASRHGPELGFL